MLSLPALAPLFDVGTRYGLVDPGVWTQRVEDEFEHPTLLARIKASRREEHLRIKVAYCARVVDADSPYGQVDLFVATRAVRVKYGVLHVWCSYVVRRRRCRYLMAEGILRFHVVNTAEALQHWVRVCLPDIRVVSIQRALRGKIGRERAKIARRKHAESTKVRARTSPSPRLSTV
jgi:hypothetical protein